MVGAFTAGLALATIESLGEIYLRLSNSRSTDEDEQFLHEVMGSSLLLAEATGASLGVTWAGAEYHTALLHDARRPDEDPPLR